MQFCKSGTPVSGSVSIMSNSEDWKERYLSSIERFERREKVDQERIDLLCRSLVRVSLAADGLDEDLDEKMSALRTALRKNSEILDLEPLIRELEAAVVKLDARRQKESSSLEEIIIASLDYLLNIEALPRKIKSAIKKYQKQLPGLISDGKDPMALWKPYLDIQVEAARFFSADEDSAPKQSLFKRLFSGSDDGQDNATAESVDAVAEPVETTAPDQSSPHDEMAAARQLYQQAPEDAAKREKLRQRIASVLSGLLQKIELNNRDEKRRGELIVRIQQGFDWPELPDILEEAARLLANTRTVVREEFEGFLFALHERLADVQKFLEVAREGEAAAQVNQQRLDSEVRKELNQIGHTVSERTDIETIKLDINSMITRIVLAVDNFHSSERDRRDNVYEHMEKLGEQMLAMEQETNELKASLEESRISAMQDSLTDLPNRKAYDEHISREFTRWQRHKAPLSIAVCDIDHFKSINDTLGHLRGDKVLKLVARELSRKVRNEDFVARYGGEEFVIVMADTNLECAVIAVEKVRAAIEQCPFNFNNERIAVTASFGVAEFTLGDTIEDCFERADKAVYAAKDKGRNRVETSGRGESGVDLDQQSVS